MWVILPHPTLVAPNINRITDPTDVDDNFYALAQAVNGSLGIENIAGGGLVTPALLQFARSVASLHFDIDLSITAGVVSLCQLPVAAKLIAIGVSKATSDFTGTVSNGAQTIANLAPPPGTGVLNGWLQTNILIPNIAANTPLNLLNNTGSLVGITLYLTFPHTA